MVMIPHITSTPLLILKRIFITMKSRVLMMNKCKPKSKASLHHLADPLLTLDSESTTKISRRRLSTLLSSSLENSQLPALNSSRHSISDAKSFQLSLITSEEVLLRHLRLSLLLHGQLYKSSLISSTTLSKKETLLLLVLSAELSMNSSMTSLNSVPLLRLHAKP